MQFVLHRLDVLEVEVTHSASIMLLRSRQAPLCVNQAAYCKGERVIESGNFSLLQHKIVSPSERARFRGVWCNPVESNFLTNVVLRLSERMRLF